jgi:hypothetical protein
MTLRPVIVLATTLLILPACGGEHADSGQSTRTTANASYGGHVEFSRVKFYSSMAELAKDSKVIVLATPTGEKPTVENLADQPGMNISQAEKALRPSYTIANLEVATILNRVPVPAEIRLRTMSGTPESALKPGTSYLLFLDDFEWTPGKPTGEYTPVGGVGGVFEVRGGDVLRVDTESQAIPERQSLDEVVKSIG